MQPEDKHERPISQMSVLEAALYYVRRGWSIIPVEAGKKKPFDLWTEFQNRLPTDEELRDWFDGPNAHTVFAVVLGPISGRLGCRDFDEADAYDAWAEKYHEWASVLPTVKTARGCHVYFRIVDGANLPDKAAIKYEDGELRIERCICLLPPCKHPSGHNYEWIVPLPDGDLPEIDPAEIGLVGDAPAKAPTAFTSNGHIPKGTRNATLTSMAGAMRRRGMSEAAICAALLTENATHCDPPLDDAEVRRIAKSVSTYPPAESSLPADCHRTEIGNAQRLVAMHGADLRYVGAAKRWYVWDGCRWGTDETGEIYRRAKDTIANIYTEAGRLGDEADRQKLASWAMRSETEKQIKAMIALAQSDPLIAVRPDVFDTDPWLLTCANGTLDLRTGCLRPHRREDHITRLVPTPYVPDATCQLWDAYLQRVTNGDIELQAFLKRTVGYSLTGDASEQVMFILYGTGQNGKSKFLEVLRLLLGDYALNTATKTLLVKTPGDATNDLARLYGARLVTAVEWEDGQRFAESLVKQVTGGDVVTARFLHKEFFDFVPTFKLFLATNHKPPIRGTDFAIWRRIRLIPFLVTIPDDECDKHIVDKLRLELSGILRWAVEGCLEWRRDGLGESPSVREATASYRIESDVLGRFLSERCVESAAARVSSGALYKEYVSWCGENGETAMTQTAFGMRLAERGFAKRKIHGVQNWHGIGLMTEAADGRGVD